MPYIAASYNASPLITTSLHYTFTPGTIRVFYEVRKSP